MLQNGWRGAPIDVVRMEDGGLTTIDNTRLLAASRAGVDVQAVVHDAGEPLTTDQVTRFTRGDAVPRTWGDAVTIRIQNQNSQFRQLYPMGSPIIGSQE
jgi:hypothetical protein